jgi:hypothetical protein
MCKHFTWLFSILIVCFSMSSLSATEKSFRTIIVKNEAELYQAVQKANRLNSGTDIVLAAGRYNITQRLQLTGSHISLRSLSGDPSSVILSGQGMKKTSTAEVLIDVSGSYISLSGLTLEQSANHLIQVRAENNANDFSLNNCILRDSYEQLLKVSAVHTNGAAYADGGRIENCLFEYTAGIGPQFYIGGIDAHRSRNWTVSGNTFKNIASPSKHVAEHAIHFWRKSSNITVTNNTILDCDRGIGFGLGGDPVKQTNGGLIKNNVIRSTNLSHPYSDAGIILEASPNVQIIKNNIYIETSYPNAIEYRFFATKNVLIKDNITNKAITSRNGGQATLSGNIKASVIRNIKHNLEYLKERL